MPDYAQCFTEKYFIGHDLLKSDGRIGRIHSGSYCSNLCKHTSFYYISILINEKKYVRSKCSTDIFDYNAGSYSIRILFFSRQSSSILHYNTTLQNFDMLEFIFRLYKTKSIDEELWLRWEATAKSMMTIPKFKKVWDKTKDSRSGEFRKFIDSL
ncbi:MAG: hypothetical protein ACJ71K_10745 [Nitrososphaeraceae archaeon]